MSVRDLIIPISWNAFGKHCGRCRGCHYRLDCFGYLYLVEVEALPILGLERYCGRLCNLHFACSGDLAVGRINEQSTHRQSTSCAQ
jgi:hypothetical protein